MSNIADNKVLKQRIEDLKKEKNAVVLGHYYLPDEVQEVCDYLGDSLALAQRAQNANADIIVFCGVHFMAETAKILNPNTKVLVPDLNANCSLAQGCDASDFEKFKAQHPEHFVISYINCSAEIKALSDLICTSGNAIQLVNALPKEQPIIFAPDRNLGGYINRLSGREMLLWDGACRVHDAISVDAVKECKQQYPDAAMIAHPECREEVVALADYVGSTKSMLGYIAKSDKRQFIVVTEEGIMCQMRKMFPDREFIGLSGEGIVCRDMKMNTMESLYECLLNEKPELLLPEALMEASRRSIERMLEMSRSLGLIK